MPELLTMQDLANGHLDVKALGEAANGDENTIVTTRTGETYPSAKKAISEGIVSLFENGGLPATPFKTKALMTASSLVDGEYAMVTDDTVNNGLYYKDGGIWSLSGYGYKSPLKGIDIDIKSSEIKTAMPSGLTLKWIPTNTYFVAVEGGTNYAIQANSVNPTLFAFSGETLASSGSNVYNPKDVFRVAADTYVVFKTPADCTRLLIQKSDGGKDRTPARLVKQDGNKPLVGEPIKVVGSEAVQGIEESNRLLLEYNKNRIDRISPEVAEYRDIRSIPSDDFKVDSRFGFYEDANALFEVTNTEVDSYELVLKKDDKVSFNYNPYDGVNLWIWKVKDYTDSVLRSYPLLGHNNTSSEIKSHEFVAYKDMTVRFSNIISGSIKVNGVTKSANSLGKWKAYLTPTATTTGHTGLFYNYMTSNFIKLEKGDSVRVGATPLGGFSLVVLDYSTYKMRALYGVPTDYPAGSRKLEWTADKACYVRISSNGESAIEVKRHNDIRFLADEKPLIDDYSVPTKMELPDETSSVFATAMNYILKTEVIEGVDYILISRDLGKSWTQVENILGDIVHYHFFADGTIMLCSPTKVYWTDDYVTLNESVVYDFDGSLFEPVAPDRHFFAMQNSDKVMMTKGGEIFAWGDYSLESIARMWYTTDRGRTIKAAYKSGETIVDGKVRTMRHFHRINYRSKDEFFYITTGDHTANGVAGGENMVLRANYVWETDTWEWKFYNAGWKYKFGAIFFDDIYAYLVTDFTDASVKHLQGLYRVLPEFLGDFSKYERLYEPDLVGGAFSRYLMDSNGTKVILPDAGTGVIGSIWVARKGFDFQRVDSGTKTWFAYIIGSNYNGDIYTVAFKNIADFYPNNGENIKLNRGTYNLTEIIRSAGVSNFMRDESNLGNYGSVSEQP